MKILIVNYVNFGGAGRACVRLHKGLLDNKVESTLLLKGNTDSNLPEAIVYSAKQKQKTIWIRILRRISRLKCNLGW